MTSAFTIACIILSLFVLGILTVIDLRLRLLPNKYVGSFLVLGLFFQFLTDFYYCSLLDVLLGSLAGGGLLYVVRAVANRFYGFDTLGLGDVKLIAAAGVWLGLSDIFMAISVGAFAGLLHGVAYKFYQQFKTGEHILLTQLTIPAGPGFILGILIIGVLKFYSLPAVLGF